MKTTLVYVRSVSLLKMRKGDPWFAHGYGRSYLELPQMLKDCDALLLANNMERALMDDPVAWVTVATSTDSHMTISEAMEP